MSPLDHKKSLKRDRLIKPLLKFLRSPSPIPGSPSNSRPSSPSHPASSATTLVSTSSSSATRPPSLSPSSLCVGSEKELAAIALSARIEEELGVRLSVDQSTMLLRRMKWDSKEALKFCEEVLNADEGIVEEVGEMLSGAENYKGATCYIDSLLFAMFAKTTAFDGMLTSTVESPERRRLQTWVRLFVNQLRSGRLVTCATVAQLWDEMRQSGWHGVDERGEPTQEDSGELFVFLTTELQSPYLPLGVKLMHGAKEDVDDNRLVTERLIPLSIPAGHPTIAPDGPLRLEEVLSENFFGNLVSDVRRMVPQDEKSSVEISVRAWQVLELLPFYSSLNEQGDEVQAYSYQFPDESMVLPLCLKRYRYNHQGHSSRIKRQIFVPASLDFSPFVSGSEDASDTIQGYRLELVSVVCHQGESVQAGHYVAYVSDGRGGYWRHDDLDSPRIRPICRERDVAAAFVDFSWNAYLLCYALRRDADRDRNATA
ncbi:uncharacterized protein VTP21DRAFT_4423 [Calcarisporiella thermophila]|uniref:uncharacterized protein n=1 Tax=Calcarisporiella thermophila TaxID=911321 RepID=UPI003742C6D0